MTLEKVKFCWLAKQYSNGWGLGFCIGNKNPVWLSGIRFANTKDVAQALSKGNVVFVEMK